MRPARSLNGLIEGIEVAPLSRTTLQEQVYHRIRFHLMAGLLVPGERVPVRALAEMVGASTMPTRDAVARLVTEGALEISRQRQTIIPALTQERFDELWRLRILLEGRATELAALTGSSEMRMRLTERFDDLEVALRLGDVGEYISTNYEFHFAIYSLARSPILLQLIENLWAQYGPVIALIIHKLQRGKDDAEILIERHRAILDGVLSRDRHAARQALETDIHQAAGLFKELLRCGYDGTSSTDAKSSFLVNNAGCATKESVSSERTTVRNRRKVSSRVRLLDHNASLNVWPHR